MKIFPVEAELFHADRQADRWSDRHDKANSSSLLLCRCAL